MASVYLVQRITAFLLDEDRDVNPMALLTSGDTEPQVAVLIVKHSCTLPVGLAPYDVQEPMLLHAPHACRSSVLPSMNTPANLLGN